MKRVIGVIGLGYVGAPLAQHFAEKYPVVGFDINESRVNELNSGFDRTLELETDQLQKVIDLYKETNGERGLLLSSDLNSLKACTIYVISIPTPVDIHNSPDLTPLKAASELVGRVISKGNIVIYESTVYPGATEGDCVPVIEETSGLVYNQDFFVGYSPERINPGDKVHTFVNTVKIVSGSTPETLDQIDELYSSVLLNGTHRAPNIKTAEAAKMVENVQRDVNVALVNELAKVFFVLKIDTKDVLDAAGTKWNFLHFSPGLVGGHCIGVDPYYLIQKSKLHGYLPQIVMKARQLNDSMSFYCVQRLCKLMNRRGVLVKNASILILGYTFKENCPDIRNTKVIDIYHELEVYSNQIDIFDPWVDTPTRVPIQKELTPGKRYDAIIVAVGHTCFRELSVRELLNPNGVIFDIKSFLPQDESDERL